MTARINTPRSDRLTLLEHMLLRSETGLRVVELAAHCEVDRRTIYRDLELMQAIGIPLYQRDGRFYLDRERYQAAIRFTFDEQIALMLAATSLLKRAQMINPHITSALHKLNSILAMPATHIPDVYPSDEVGTALEQRTWIEVLEVVSRAWGDQRPVRVWYRGRKQDRMIERVFEPCELHMTAAGVMFVRGYDRETQRMHVISLRRIRRVQTLSGGVETEPAKGVS